MSIQIFKNAKRLNRIAVTLIRYGFGAVVAEMRIFPFLSSIERVFVPARHGELSTPVRIRLVLEELGPTFIKLGQIASTRADLLPPDWIGEFKKLQDMVAPIPFEDVRKVVEGALKSPIEDRFSSFSPSPIASASIAQVHLAELKAGEKVAVKVRRPGIERIVEADVSVMHTVAALLERYVAVSRRYKPLEVVREFERVIEKEMDLTIEAGNASRFKSMFKANPTVQIPGVFWQHTGEAVLTMERIEGTPIDEPERIRAKGIDIEKVALNGVELFFQQVFEHGTFHADLHPGNIFVRDDGVIIYLDFGIVGYLDRDLRRYLASMLYNLVSEDYYKMAVVHREMGLIGEDVSLHEFEAALRDIAEPIFGKPLQEISVSALLMKLIQTARRFNMTLQPNLLLLQKSMVIIEGVGRQLCPGINMWESAKPLIYKWMLKERFSPSVMAGRGADAAEELGRTAYELPVHANSLLMKAVKQELKIGFMHHNLETVTDEIEGAGKRIAGGLVVGSLIIGASVVAIFSGNDATRLAGLPALSLAGYAVAAIVGVRIFRAGR